MKAFTIENGKVSRGILVDTHTLKTAGVTLPIVGVGEPGRGRQFSYLPVSLKDSKSQWESEGKVIINNVTVGVNQNILLKLVESGQDSNTDQCLIVFLTHFGYRGGNAHTGDKSEEKGYLPFPGEVLVSGRIAHGDAGNMGAGSQIIAVMPSEKVFRIGYSGRLYGTPDEHFGIYQDGELLLMTYEERIAFEIF